MNKQLLCLFLIVIFLSFFPKSADALQCYGTSYNCDGVGETWECSNGASCSGSGGWCVPTTGPCTFIGYYCDGPADCDCVILSGICQRKVCYPGQVPDPTNEDTCIGCVDREECPTECGQPAQNLPDGMCGTHACDYTGDCCTISSPATPTLSSPASGASFVGVSSVALSWGAVTAWGEECSGTANRSYEICVGTNSTDPCSGGTTLTTSDPTTPATSSTYNQTAANTYCWKVKSVNKGSASSAWSGISCFTITNRPPVITSSPPSTNYVTPLEIPRTGASTLYFSPSDPDGGGNISNVYLSMTNCTTATGDAGWSTFEHNMANWFGGLWGSDGSRAIIQNGPVSSCATGYPSPNTNPWTYGLPRSNVPGNVTLNSITTSISGNNRNTEWNLDLNNFPVGNHYTYGVVMDNQGFWHTSPITWTRLNQVCAEGGPYVVVTPPSPTCGNQTTTCTQDCTSINNCTGYPTSTCYECGPYLVSTPSLTTCGNHTTTCTEDCGSDNCVGYPLASCLECGPTVGSWSIWSTCGAGTHKRTRTRTCTETCTTDGSQCSTYFASNCPAGSTCATTGSGLSWTQTATQDCTGTVTGTLYDASDASSCAGMSVPINGGGTATIGITGPWPTTPSPVTVATNGVFGFTAYTPGNYSPNFQPLVDLGLIGSSTPKFVCLSADITFSGSSTGCTTQPCENITGQNYGFFRKYDGWWQANGGPVYAGDSAGSDIPSSIPGNMFLINPITNHKGFLLYGNSYDLGTNPNAYVNASDTHLQGTNESTVIFNYDFFSTKLSSLTSDVTWTSSNLPNYNDVGGKGFMLIKYTGATGTLSIAAKAITAGQKYIALVPAGVNINVTGNIAIANTGFLAIIAKGNINFGSSVTAAQGWYLTDGAIAVSSTGNETTEQQFTGTGSFVGRTGITLNRDRGVTNNTAPAEIFTYSASQLVAAPDVIKFPYKKYTPYRP